MSAAGTDLWNVQKFDQTIGVYTNLDAARDHGDHIIHRHYQDAMNRHRVPDSHRAIDWRASCCGHLYGPGRFSTSSPDTHAEGCDRTKPTVLCLRPFWVTSGKSARTGHVSTDWEIWQGVARHQFDPSMV